MPHNGSDGGGSAAVVVVMVVVVVVVVHGNGACVYSVRYVYSGAILVLMWDMAIYVNNSWFCPHPFLPSYLCLFLLQG